jgi:uncharacterized glyoxalase superfamily protein PhnB
MNKEMKQLIDVLNNNGYEVMEIKDLEWGGNPYKFSGKFGLTVNCQSKCLSNSQSCSQYAEERP